MTTMQKGERDVTARPKTLGDGKRLSKLKDIYGIRFLMSLIIIIICLNNLRPICMRLSCPSSYLTAYFYISTLSHIKCRHVSILQVGVNVQI